MTSPSETVAEHASAKPRDNHVVVIGGGVIGAAAAYCLSQSGADVTIVEKGQFGRACSHGNCGYVSPSHAFPLCQPGAVSSTMKTMFQRNSPFSVKLRMDPSFLKWMWSFARNCNREHMFAAGHARSALLNSSRDLYGKWMASGDLTDIEWQSLGLLFVFDSVSEFEHHSEVVDTLREHFEIGAAPYAGEKLTELEPALKPGPAGGWLYEGDSHLRPDRLMSRWKELLLNRGVTIREQCEFLEFDDRKQVKKVRTNTGGIEADQVLVATGAWTPLLSRQLQHRVPIEPGKGYSLTMNRPANCPKYPMLFEEHRVGVTPMETGYRLGSTMEFAGFDESINPKRLKLLTDGAKHYLHDPVSDPVLETWFGWRPMSCDGVPMIGKVPGSANVWIASGHSMLGLSMSPATGKLITEMMTGTTPHLDVVPYRLERF